MNELRLNWEHTLPEDGSKLAIRSNWVSGSPAAQAYLEVLIARIAEIDPASKCVLDTRQATVSRSSPSDLGTFTSAHFWRLSETLNLQPSPSLAAARLVLVEGMRPSRAARQLHTTPQALTNILRKLRTAHATSDRLRGSRP